MRKQEIEIGGTYAVHVGYGKPSQYSDLLKCEVVEFDWDEPLPASYKGSSWRWERDHRGTRCRVIESPHLGGIYKVGTEHAIQNRRIIAPWDEHVQDKAESAIWAEFRGAERRADRVARDAIDAAWETYLSGLKLDERDRLRLDSYRSPNALTLARFARAAIDDYGAGGLAAFERVRDTALASATEKIEAAQKVRDEALRKLGAEVPTAEEIEVAS